MALTRRLASEISPREQHVPRLDELPVAGLQFHYHRKEDALYIAFFGESLPSLSVPLDRGDHDYFWLRRDFETDAVTGAQIDHFLVYALSIDSWLSDALLVAEYPDSTEEQSAAIRKQAAERVTGPWSDERFLDQLRRVVNE